MYDYLGGEQIKIFYVPIFNPKGTFDNKPSITHSGGRLRSFGIYDELPLKTIYYQYPENFLVYDFRMDFDDIWIIKNGKFDKLTSSNELVESDVVGPVYDYFGRKYTIKTFQDFFDIKNETELARKKDDEAEYKLFPDGVWQTLRENEELFKEKESEWDKIKYKETKKCNKKWYAIEEFADEMKFGEAIDCFIMQLSMIEQKPIPGFTDPMLEYGICKKYIQKMIRKDDTIVERYKNWLNDEKILEQIGFYKLLTEILS